MMFKYGFVKCIGNVRYSASLFNGGTDAEYHL